MRVVVVREFTDKYTGVGHVIGEKLTVTAERFAEVQEKGMFLVDVSDGWEDEPTPEPETEEAAETEEVAEAEKADAGTKRKRTKKESEEK